ncbi:hypothetical protein [Tenacibaculum finnmarkense]|uniref:hypothetical protein n=1 Tax=Tenacibaculum finnmarkense TaxID=2781243 RepID=UPI001E574D97|nr:hypothetical protein [Tenacibaculum finnmarkense]MCD8403889.1 hypothetical protein [Tenacibaculum finnmarkense genomovar finnmarkense]
MNLKKILTLDLIETSIRIWTAFFIFIYGMSKSTQFESSKLVDISIKDATEFEMMWAFFGTTKEYPIIIGCLQIIGAILLVFRKTKLFGAILLTPIFINIILLDIFYKIHFGALLNAIIYQSVFIFIIIQQRKRIGEVFKILIIENDKKISIGISVAKFVIAVILATILFFGFQKLSGYI